VADLFSDSPDAYVQFLGGRYRAKAGIKRLYISRFAGRFVAGRNGPVHGFLLDHPQMQGIIDIDASGNKASARFRSMMQAGVHASQADTHPRGVTQWWEGGIYENEYIKEPLPDGGESWRIFRLRYFPFWHADFEHGWAYKVAGFVPFPKVAYPEDPMGPDEVFPEEQQALWPDARVVPFHYAHPVTGAQVADEDLQAPVWGTDAKQAKPALKLEP
jgi:hypothetical protein